MKQMTAKELHAYLQSGEKPLMIDVREAHELPHGMIEGAIHVPMNDIPARLHELDDYKDKTIVLICRSGKRSEQVAEFMHFKGFADLVNLNGGMNSWAMDVDSNMSVY